MTRLVVHVEGETEHQFVNEVLAPHLQAFNFNKVSHRMISGTGAGGITSWRKARQDIITRLKQNPDVYVTTMVDCYGLQDDWPRVEQARMGPAPGRASLIEDGMLEDVVSGVGDDFGLVRFVPYVMLHEFEAMLFADCRAFARAIGHPDLALRFQSIQDMVEFASPEDIDDSPEGAPSKRIESLMAPNVYAKPRMGLLAVQEIGLDAIRAACPHFRMWLERLEALPGLTAK